MTNPSSDAPSNTDLPPVYIGLPMWQHSHWPTHWFANPGARQQGLNYYARQLNSVEGNTTFYALPEPDSVARWHEQTPEAFRFTFKFHQSISHQSGLVNCTQMAEQQLTLLAPLASKTGVMMLQLPASFGPQRLGHLEQFLSSLPGDWHYAVEVRHPAWFAKGAAEREFNQMLMELKVNRVIMDTRGLFTGPVDSPITEEVRQKKPRVPVNVIATHTRPVVRFVGGNDESVNVRCLQPWVNKCHQWQQQGLSPYLFFHRPDNKDAPWLAAQFITLYNQAYPASPLPQISFPAVADQASLF